MFALSHSFALDVNKGSERLLTWACLCCFNSIHVFNGPEVWQSNTALNHKTCKGLQQGLHHVNIVQCNLR